MFSNYPSSVQEVRAEANSDSSHSHSLCKSDKENEDVDKVVIWENASVKTWIYAFWFGFMPLTIVAGINAYFLEKEHLSHPPPPYIPYEHLYGTITKRFPWGDGKRSLFFNPKRNPLPGVGYVDE